MTGTRSTRCSLSYSLLRFKFYIEYLRISIAFTLYLLNSSTDQSCGKKYNSKHNNGGKCWNTSNRVVVCYLYEEKNKKNKSIKFWHKSLLAYYNNIL